MALKASSIIERIKAGEITIEPFSEDRLKEASYTLSIDRDLTLEPGVFSVVETNEKLGLGSSICGILFTRGSIARRGVDALMTDCFVEPGFKGKLKHSVINNSQEVVTFKAEQTFVKIVFSQVE